MFPKFPRQSDKFCSPNDNEQSLKQAALLSNFCEEVLASTCLGADTWATRLDM